MDNIESERNEYSNTEKNEYSDTEKNGNLHDSWEFVGSFTKEESNKTKKSIITTKKQQTKEISSKNKSEIISENISENDYVDEKEIENYFLNNETYTQINTCEYPSTCSWMKKFHSLSIRQYTLPGTHNSACYDFQMRISQMTDAAKCQEDTIMLQLFMGVRYFDIRIRENENDFWIGHTFQTSVTLVDVLWTLKIFLKMFPSEVVILDLDFEKLATGVGKNNIRWNLVSFLMYTLFEKNKIDLTKEISLFVNKIEDSDSSTSKIVSDSESSITVNDISYSEDKDQENLEQISKIDQNIIQMDWRNVDIEIWRKRRPKKYNQIARNIITQKKITSNIPENILNKMYGRKRLKFELWWNDILKFVKRNPNFKFPEKQVNIFVPKNLELSSVGKITENNHQIILICDFIPSHGWNASVKVKSWPATQSSESSRCLKLWIEFCKKFESIWDLQELTFDLSQSSENETGSNEETHSSTNNSNGDLSLLWMHLNCVLTLPESKFKVSMIFFQGFSKYYKKCLPILVDFLKNGYIDVKKLQIVDCDFITQEICDLLIEINNRKLLELK